MTNFEAIARGLIRILDDIGASLPDDTLADARDLLKHEEFGEALSLICTQLYEYEIPIEEKTYQQIQSLGRSMGMSSEEWTILQQQVR